MKVHLYACVLLLHLLLAFSHGSYCQSSELGSPALPGATKASQLLPGLLTDNSTLTSFPSTLLTKLDYKAAAVNDRLEKQTLRYLDRLSRKEAKLKRKLYKIDSLKTKALFPDAANQYAQLAGKVKNAPSTLTNKLTSSVYIPSLDSISTGLKFLKIAGDNTRQRLGSMVGSSHSLATSSDLSGKLQGSLQQINQLQNRLQSAEEIKSFIRERKQQLKEALSKYTDLPKRITNSYQSYAKEVYYYQAQVKAYKEILNDPNKIEQKALELLNKVPAFTDFMQKNSLLASLFPLPANYGTPAALAGLQTRAQVQQLITSTVASGGPNAQDLLQQNIQAAQNQLSQLKDKVNQLGGSSADIDMPDFRPNNQKTKSFKDRIELGSNLQTIRSSSYFPTSSDVALSAGYRLNDKSIIGVGTSYRVGWGRDIRHIAFTSEGIGVRSYFDYKIKGSFWLSGGAEMNYRTRFNNIQALKDASAWSPSALVGLSKKYSVSKKVKGEFKLLYDALWQEQVPRGQPVLFRVGYTLK